MSSEDGHTVIVATVNAGERKLVYVDGELRENKEADNLDFSQVGDLVDGPIAQLEEEWRIGDVEKWDPPETYEKLCQITDV